MKKQIYYATSIAQTYEHEHSKRIKEGLVEAGFEVYAPALNDSINDKRNDPTPMDIYEADVGAITESDIFLVNVTGGRQEGTIFEIGLVSGINSVRRSQGLKPIELYFFTTNTRILDLQVWNLRDDDTVRVASVHINHLIVGALELNGKFLGDEDSMLRFFKEEYS